jgi:hypothetical protein
MVGKLSLDLDLVSKDTQRRGAINMKVRIVVMKDSLILAHHLPPAKVGKIGRGREAINCRPVGNLGPKIFLKMLEQRELAPLTVIT